jgi:hypothetical protein
MRMIGGAVGVTVLVTMAERHNDALAGSLRSAAEGFSFALTIAAALVALGAILIATLLRTRWPSRSRIDPA